MVGHVRPAGHSLFLVILLASCTAMEPSDEAAREAILRQADRWVEAAEAEDTESLAALYRKDAVFLPPGSPPVRGRDSISALFRQQFERFDSRLSFTTDEVMADGDLAFRRGSYRAELVPPSGTDTFVSHDKFMEIWTRGEDGTWRIARDMWNAQGPPPSRQPSSGSSDS